MAYPNARLLRLTTYGLEPVTVRETDHYKVMQEFWVLVERKIQGDSLAKR